MPKKSTREGPITKKMRLPHDLYIQLSNNIEEMDVLSKVSAPDIVDFSLTKNYVIT